LRHISFDVSVENSPVYWQGNLGFILIRNLVSAETIQIVIGV